MKVKTRLVIVILTGVVLLVLFGVYTADAPDEEEKTVLEATPIKGVTATAVTPISPPENIPTNAVIIFKRSGGLAGTVQEWTIFADGRIVEDNGVSQQINPERVQQTLAHIEAAGFFDLDKNEYLPDDACCDRFTYEITVVNPGRTRMVTTLADTPDMPEALQQTLTAVNSLLAGTNE